jgi:predicted PurR-regulated permease PerM
MQNENATPVIPPSYQRFSLITMGLVALVFALSVLQSLVVPLLFSLFLGILLNPLVKLFRKWGMPRFLGISVAVLLGMMALAGVGYFIVTQAAHFSDAIPQLKEKVAQTSDHVQSWLDHTTKVEPEDMEAAVQRVKQEGMKKSGAILGGTLTTVGALFGFFFLLPVFTFLIIYYKGLFHEFLTRLFPRKNQDTLEEVLDQTKVVVQSYLLGLILEAGIIAALNWVGLLIIGVKYALLMAVIGAVLNLIPYIGIIIGTILPMVVAMAFQDATAALWVLGLYLVVQFIDNHFIVPLVVASRVQINALMSIVVVIAGGMLWGIPGMFLSIPLTAMLKVVFDRIPALEPWGYVLGIPGEEEERLRKKARVRKPRK